MANRNCYPASATADRSQGCPARAASGPTDIRHELQSDWLLDYQTRGRPEMLTRLFHESAPLLKHLGWRVTRTGRGFCESVLPLNVASSNHHATHSAGVMVIAADYTAGTALGAVLHRVPVIGVHPQRDGKGACLWSVKAAARWNRPSCDTLVCSATVPSDRHERILRRYQNGQRIIETVPTRLFNGDVPVADVDMTFWLQDSRHLLASASGEHGTLVMCEHQAKSTAELIAGLRALEMDKPAGHRLFDDPFAEIAATARARVIAERFVRIAPQLQLMIATRTRHCDDALRAFATGDPCQVVNIGAGFDCRPWRLCLPRSTWFELDLPVMLRARRDLLGTLYRDGDVCVVQIPLDLRQCTPGNALAETPRFRADVPTFVIWEGGSMYFEAPQCARVLQSCAGLMQHPLSQLWFDYVDETVLEGTTGMAVVEAFMDGMQRMGARFTNGFVDVGHALAPLGLHVLAAASPNVYLRSSDPVFELHRFALVAPNRGE